MPERVDHVGLGTDQLHAVFFKDPLAIEIHREVQSRLAAHRGQNRIGLFLGDDALKHLPVEGFDVGGVGHGRIGHDGRGVGVDEHHAVALFLQRLAGLGAGIVELAGLADDDRTGPENHDGF